jgi:hypothetical protein
MKIFLLITLVLSLNTSYAQNKKGPSMESSTKMPNFNFKCATDTNKKSEMIICVKPDGLEKILEAAEPYMISSAYSKLTDPVDDEPLKIVDGSGKNLYCYYATNGVLYILGTNKFFMATGSQINSNIQKLSQEDFLKLIENNSEGPASFKEFLKRYKK